MTGAVTKVADTPGSRPVPATAERALVRAVLEDAIGCLAGEVGQRYERLALAAAARQWIENPDRHWPYSFENVCDVLGLEVGYVRTRLLRAVAPPVAHRATATPPARAARGRAPAPHDVAQMIRSGTPLRTVAERFGISVSKVSVLSCGLASRLKAERDADILQLRRAGWTYRALGAHFGLSRIRVMRICTRAGAEGRRTAA